MAVRHDLIRNPKEVNTISFALLTIHTGLFHIPKVGDMFSAGDCLFEIVGMDGNRVDKVLVKAVASETDK